MQGAQTKKKTPGAYRSCLIPYKEQIFAWWFDDRLTATDIQKRLQEKLGIEVHRSTLARFIQVRREKPDPHDYPNHISWQAPVPSVKAPSQKVKPDKSPKQPNLTLNESEGERLLGIISGSSAQKLGILAEEAKKAEKARKKPV